MARALVVRLVAAPVVAALVSCGGGGDGGGGGGSGSAPITEGAYGGTISGSPVASAFQALVLDGGELWVIYGTQSTSAFFISGLVVAGINASNGSFSTSSPGRDYFQGNPGVNVTIAGTYSTTPSPAISGTLTEAGVSATFSGGPIAGTTYNYNTPASFATISGSWTVSTTYGATATLSITPSGPNATFTASDGTGCVVSGNVNLRPSGKNIFNLNGTYGSNCGPTLSGLTVGGVAVAYPLSNGQTQFLAGLKSSTNSYGTVVAGVR